MTNSNETFPQNYYDWKEEKDFDDLKEALRIHHDHIDKVNTMRTELLCKTDNANDHDNAIAILGQLKDNLDFGCEGDKKVDKFMKKYFGYGEAWEVISYNLGQSLELLRKAKRDEFKLIIKLEDDFKKAEELREKNWEAYEKINKKHEKEYEELKKAAQATEAANVDGFMNNEYNEIEDVKKTGEEAA